MPLLLLSVLVLAISGMVEVSSVQADAVTINYTATISTAPGASIFGIDPTAGTEVNGFFTYESSTADSNASSSRGDYKHTMGGAFRAEIVGFSTVITGSATPFVQIEDLSSDTFRFIDGSSPFNQVDPDGVMSLNGVGDAEIELFLAISDSSGASFNNDSLPNPFPIQMPPNVPHTFTLSDGTESMSMQFTSFSPVPEPGIIGLSLFGCVVFAARRRR